MWWFARKAQQAAESPSSAPARLSPEQLLLEQVPDMRAMLEDNDVALKIWLPDVVGRTVKWLADYEGQNQSQWLRELLMAYVYGRAALLAQRIRTDRDGAARPDDGIRFSRAPVDRTQGRWVYKVPQLGKNVVAFKLWLSRQMCADLQALADHAQVGLSPFVREAIIADLLGRASLPERPAILGQVAHEAALAWERGEEVPVHQIAVEAFDGVGEAQLEWVASLPGQ
ncbi:MAG TPA: hypothetical protein PLJ81_05535 [Giesbergeria sp.]|jgi:hypothetical protein|nr:hypothetical protein [Giesbergeria sp.]HNK06941.1 hypothetical protein [Giesbergeria sp.]HNM39716.1 hypothetical protein [Giesbergeria sp.]